MNHLNKLLFAGLAVSTAGLQAASFNTGFQETVASENFESDAGVYGDVGPGRYVHISVNSNNAGYSSYIANDTSGNPIGSYTRTFSDPVVGWSFIGGGTNDVLTVNEESGGLVSWQTTDTSFDSFGQDQKKFWSTTDPGTDIALPADATDVSNTNHDATATGYRDFGDSTATVDISGLASGTLNVFYGAFGETPTVSAIMRDLDGGQADLEISDFHLNGDSANRTEFYAAELDFVNDLGYDQIIWDYVQPNGNGRSGGVVLTGVPEPSTLFFIASAAGLFLLRRRR